MILFGGVIWAWANMGFGANICSYMIIYFVFALHNIIIVGTGGSSEPRPFNGVEPPKGGGKYEPWGEGVGDGEKKTQMRHTLEEYSSLQKQAHRM